MKEDEIRKRDVFNRYLNLVQKDVENFFDFSLFKEGDCPACGNGEFIPEFEKIGFRYVSCKNCETLYVNPRPSFETLNMFYSKSPSTSFWVNEFFKPVEEIRREKIFRPRAEYINKFFNVNKGVVVGDIGAGFGLFLEELRKIAPENHFIAIEPSTEMAEICRAKGMDVECACLEDIKGMEGKFDILTTFELAEHLFDTASFLRKAYSLLKPGGYIFLTTLNGKGFDILSLWEKSKSIAPPHHLNFFNLESIKALMTNIGFEIVEASTPGKLDWDIVEGMIRSEGVNLGRFWDMIAIKGTDDCKIELQDWIVKNNMSSHMRVVAKKPLIENN